VVVEVMPNSGSFDGTTSIPQVKVERFGSEKINDSLYSQYDKTCGEHIRMGFRLPPLFLGLPENYNFATAYTAYMIAEAQVFQPERQRFDEVINATLMKELGAKTCKFRSLPLTLKNVEVQIQALGLVSGQVDGAGLVDEVNKLAGLSLEYKEPPAPPMGMPGGPPQLDEEGNPIQPEEGGAPGEEAGKVPPQFQKKDPNSLSGGQPQPGGNMPAVEKKPGLGLSGGGGLGLKLKSDGMELVRLAKAYLRAEGLLAAKFEMSEETKDRVYKQVAELDEAQAAQFYEMVATMTLGNPGGANLVKKHEHTDSCTQVHNSAPQVDVAAVVAPIVDLIAKQDERMAAQNEVLVDMLEKTSENTGRLAEAVIAQSERPIEVTVVNEAKKSGDKEFQFSDGRVVKLREVKGA
jgi:hypothetical protein